jgi:HAD superfamily hydrolase (TIGR01509 family)
VTNGSLRAVLFDMDGLLIDSEPLWFEVESEVMTRLGGTWSEADQEALLGSSLDRSVRYFMERAAVPADPAEVGDWMVGGIVDKVHDRGVRIMPGATELVAAVAASGLPYALVTSSQRRFVDAVLDRTGLRFPVVVTGSDVTRGKPDPEPYRLATSRLGIPPSQCLVLEDSITGVTAAEAAGCFVVAVPTLGGIEPRPGRWVRPSLAGADVAWLQQAWAEGHLAAALATQTRREPPRPGVNPTGPASAPPARRQPRRPGVSPTGPASATQTRR